MGLSIADAASLVTKGYKVNELKEVGSLIDQNPNEGNNIIELAKKLGFSEFQCAMQLFAKPDDKKSEDQNDQNDKTDENDADDQADKKGKDSPADDQGKDDDVDYKKLYEEEKSLRQKLQQKKQSEDTSGKDDKRSDWDIAVQLASDVLN